jgi:adenine-specific DNA-methyltransferase
MMRDRLLQIRELLAPDGTVWVHCDDTEQHRLRLVMDEVFGIGNYVGTIVWRSSDNSNNDAKRFSTDHNYLLVYATSEEWVSELKKAPCSSRRGGDVSSAHRDLDRAANDRPSPSIHP